MTSSAQSTSQPKEVSPYPPIQEIFQDVAAIAKHLKTFQLKYPDFNACAREQCAPVDFSWKLIMVDSSKKSGSMNQLLKFCQHWEEFEPVYTKEMQKMAASKPSSLSLIRDIPNELLLHIISYLSPYQLDPLQQSHIRLKRLVFSDKRYITRVENSFMYQYYHSRHKMKYGRKASEQQGRLIDIASHRSDQDLVFETEKQSQRVQSQILFLQTYGPFITNFSLDGLEMENFTNDDIGRAFSYLTNLKILDLSFCGSYAQQQLVIYTLEKVGAPLKQLTIELNSEEQKSATISDEFVWHICALPLQTIQIGNGYKKGSILQIDHEMCVQSLAHIHPTSLSFRVSLSNVASWSFQNLEQLEIGFLDIDALPINHHPLFPVLTCIKMQRNYFHRDPDQPFGFHDSFLSVIGFHMPKLERFKIKFSNIISFIPNPLSAIQIAAGANQPEPIGQTPYVLRDYHVAEIQLPLLVKACCHSLEHLVIRNAYFPITLCSTTQSTAVGGAAAAHNNWLIHLERLRQFQNPYSEYSPNPLLTQSLAHRCSLVADDSKFKSLQVDFCMKIPYYILHPSKTLSLKIHFPVTHFHDYTQRELWLKHSSFPFGIDDQIVSQTALVEIHNHFCTSGSKRVTLLNWNCDSNLMRILSNTMMFDTPTRFSEIFESLCDIEIAFPVENDESLALFASPENFLHLSQHHLKRLVLSVEETGSSWRKQNNITLPKIPVVFLHSLSELAHVDTNYFDVQFINCVSRKLQFLKVENGLCTTATTSDNRSLTLELVDLPLLTSLTIVRGSSSQSHPFTPSNVLTLYNKNAETDLSYEWIVSNCPQLKTITWVDDKTKNNIMPDKRTMVTSFDFTNLPCIQSICLNETCMESLEIDNCPELQVIMLHKTQPASVPADLFASLTRLLSMPSQLNRLAYLHLFNELTFVESSTLKIEQLSKEEMKKKTNLNRAHRHCVVEDLLKLVEKLPHTEECNFPPPVKIITINDARNTYLYNYLKSRDCDDFSDANNNSEEGE
jgi:hypothetical protein